MINGPKINLLDRKNRDGLYAKVQKRYRTISASFSKRKERANAIKRLLGTDPQRSKLSYGHREYILETPEIKGHRVGIEITGIQFPSINRKVDHLLYNLFSLSLTKRDLEGAERERVTRLLLKYPSTFYGMYSSALEDLVFSAYPETTPYCFPSPLEYPKGIQRYTVQFKADNIAQANISARRVIASYNRVHDIFDALILEMDTNNGIIPVEKLHNYVEKIISRRNVESSVSRDSLENSTTFGTTHSLVPVAFEWKDFIPFYGSAYRFKRRQSKWVSSDTETEFAYSVYSSVTNGVLYPLGMYCLLQNIS